MSFPHIPLLSRESYRLASMVTGKMPYPVREMALSIHAISRGFAFISQVSSGLRPPVWHG